MGLSVGFADEELDEAEYLVERSVLGKVFIPRQGMEIVDAVVIRYEKHPWIERFEVDGIRPLTPRRTGYGAKGARGFVQSLNSIYAPAYEEFEKFNSEPRGFFEHVTEKFINRFEDDQSDIMLAKYCGFAENMWREGNQEMCEVALMVIVPMLRSSSLARSIFNEKITSEFVEYLRSEE